MRFLADMGVSLEVVVWLRNLGHDALHLRDLDMNRAEDPDIFQFAIRDQRIILTMDLDFGAIAANTRSHPPAVILFRLHNTRANHVIARLGAVLDDLKDVALNEVVVLIEESRHRLRTLPIRSSSNG